MNGPNRCVKCGGVAWGEGHDCRPDPAPEPVAAAPEEAFDEELFGVLSLHTIWTAPDGVRKCITCGPTDEGGQQHLTAAILASDWLRDHDAALAARVRAEAWDEGWQRGHNCDYVTEGMCEEYCRTRNPYRAALGDGHEGSGT